MSTCRSVRVRAQVASLFSAGPVLVNQFRVIHSLTGSSVRQTLPRYATSPTMSSETTGDLADLVNEWLRIDQVRVDNILT